MADEPENVEKMRKLQMQEDFAATNKTREGQPAI
ncbi:hypothetical protein IMCC3135_14055 [Granulosicoccus antarcticus IMCC3135]|uniref:Uncharacterized protein n=1 Tax=Granulosicoccus antarcticus IMCC3135 TaxID=1192854 RepID=A0A2Z2NNC0_9GAMM|nr:hypothetical protein IMCC3135_14055 [Granulosicoccus antarcticus IMCC3135]